MKKLLIVLIAAAFAISCTGPRGPEGPPGGLYIKVIDYTVNSDDWVAMEDKDGREYFEYSFNTPEISKYIFEKGSVNGYVYAGGGGDFTSSKQTPLPYVVHFFDDNDYYTETTTFDYSVNKVRFTFTYSDLYTDYKPPTMKFRVVLQW